MKVDVYTGIRNEIFMMPYFLRHYLTFADRIFVWDDDSTDGTRELLAQYPEITILPLEVHGIDDEYNQKIRSETYRKLSRGVADWVIIVDCDEFHYHTQLEAILCYAKGHRIKALLSAGWQMIGDRLPCKDGQIWEEISEGVPDPMYSRLIFNPEIDVTVGIGHHSYDMGYWPRGVPSLKLLHFRYFGPEYLKQRHAKGWNRLTEQNKQRGWGIHTSPGWNGIYSQAWYDQAMKEKRSCLD